MSIKNNKVSSFFAIAYQLHILISTSKSSSSKQQFMLLNIIASPTLTWKSKWGWLLYQCKSDSASWQRIEVLIKDVSHITSLFSFSFTCSWQCHTTLSHPNHPHLIVHAISIHDRSSWLPHNLPWRHVDISSTIVSLLEVVLLGDSSTISSISHHHPKDLFHLCRLVTHRLILNLMGILKWS